MAELFPEISVANLLVQHYQFTSWSKCGVSRRTEKNI
jgi:hypothetical protein